MGQMVWEGVQVAHQLQPQVLGQPVKLVLLDTRSDRIEAANAVSRLIEKDKVAAIIGEVISSDTLAGGPIAERAGIPNLSPTATNPLVTQNRQYAFRACFEDGLQGRVAARFAWENLKARRVALLIDQAQDYCVGLANFFKEEFQRRGGQVVSTSYIQTGDQDFSAQISALKGAKPDLDLCAQLLCRGCAPGQTGPGSRAENPHPHRGRGPGARIAYHRRPRGGRHVFHRPLPPPRRQHRVRAAVHADL